MLNDNINTFLDKFFKNRVNGPSLVFYPSKNFKFSFKVGRKKIKYSVAFYRTEKGNICHLYVYYNRSYTGWFYDMDYNYFNGFIQGLLNSCNL